MMATTILSSGLLLSTAILSSGLLLSVTGPCANVTSNGIVPKADCLGWYVCNNRSIVENHDCGSWMLYNRLYHRCYIRGMGDICTIQINEQCANGARFIQHPTLCQLYYNCSRDSDLTGIGYLAECTYPDLFNSETKSCEPFQNVHCGQRRVIKDECGYRLHAYCASTRGLCYNCYIDRPTCAGLPDGQNADSIRMWTPMYILCFNERLIRTGTCPKNIAFHPELRKCVTWAQIDIQHGGTLSHCSGKTDGFHADELTRCDRYTVCKNGNLQGTVKCDNNTVFDTINERCGPIEVSCSPPPCGDPNSCNQNPN